MSYSTIACPKCANMNEPENKFCGYCGHEIIIEIMCPRCNTKRKEKEYGSQIVGTHVIETQPQPLQMFDLNRITDIGLINKGPTDYLRFCTNCGYDYVN